LIDPVKEEYEAKQLAGDAEDYHEWGDEIFSPTFRRGFDGYLLERKLARRAQAEGSGPSQYGLGETDWEQEAVVNEDDLFFDSANSITGRDEQPMSDIEVDFDEEEEFDEEAYIKNRGPKK
jgi:hypothetical protein